MAQVFSISGSATVPAPIMSGGYYPGIDRPMIDGRGVVQPWGGGPLSRQFQLPVIIGQEPSEQARTEQLLSLMIQSQPGGNIVNYNFEGLIGPPGMPGPAGPTMIIFGRDIEGNILNAPTRVLDDGQVPATVASVECTAMVGAIMIEWTANSELDISHYRIYRYTSDASGSSSKIAETAGTVIVDGGRTGGTTYYYWVKAVDFTGNVSAAYSTTASAAPTLSTLTADSPFTIDMTFA